MASQFLYRTDDRGNTWKRVSPDLTRQVDRNRLEVMGRIWGPDAVAKNTSTALYSNISAVAESPKKEGLLYVGTDDGLVQVSEDGGTTWRKVDRLPGVPADAYVARIRASQHDERVAYVTLTNHQNGDFAPYALKTTDMGRTWTSINGDLPKRGGTFGFAEDHVDPNLLFIGTEFAAYASKDGGRHWMKIPGLPVIKVAYIAIQTRENDLVLGTFGRGIYIVDDYSPLRALNADAVTKAATLFPARDALLYVPTQHYGGSGKAFQGEMLFGGDNPPYGAVFTYFLKDPPKTLKQKRLDAERAAERANQPIRYPTADELRAEAAEEAPALLLTISDASGKAIRTFSGTSSRGINRVAWDLRYPSHQLAAVRRADDDDDDDGGGFGGGANGPFVVPGQYSVSLAQRVGGVVTPLAGPVSFNVTLDQSGGLTLADHQARGAFQGRVQELRRQMTGATELATATNQKLDQMRRALDQTPGAPAALQQKVREYLRQVTAIQVALSGDRSLGSRSDPSPASISSRLQTAAGHLNRTLQRPTATAEEQVRIVEELFAAEQAKLRQLVTVDVPALEREVEATGAPYTAGRVVGR